MKKLILTFLLASLIADHGFAQATPPAFQRLDKNGDGKLTRDEAPNADSFVAADANKDGAVTPKEFVRYMAARRQTPSTPAPARPALIHVDENALLASAAAGRGQTLQKHQQFAERMIRDQSGLFGFILSLVPNRADAEEVFQHASLTL